MNNIIDTFEKIGSNAALRHAAVESTLTSSGIEPEIRLAILSGDRTALEAAVGAQRNVCCMVGVPDDLTSQSPE